MIADILTVMWKEWRELLAQSGRSRGGKLGVLVFVGVFGVFMPLQTGRAWVESPVGLVYWAWVPLFLVNSVIADSFAGERERHTLETLLASRLSDLAILLGKVGTGVAYGWGLAMVGLLLSLVTVNLAHAGNGLILYPPDIGLGIVVLSLLGALLAAGAGVLVSLRAATVRQAAQTLSLAVLLLIFLPALGLQALPREWLHPAADFVASAGIGGLVAAAAGVLLVVDVALLLAAAARFQRARLVLD